MPDAAMPDAAAPDAAAPDAATAMDVIPAEARLHLDCRVPPGMRQEEVLARVRDVIGEPAGVRVDVTERIVGNASPPESPPMDALRRWVQRTDPGARCPQAISTGCTGSNTFRSAFPEMIAYGFFPHRHQSLHDTAPLVHSHDERIDVRDLALATRCFREVAVELLGGPA